MEENNKKMESIYTSISLWDSKAEHEVFQCLHKIIMSTAVCVGYKM